MVNQFKQMSEEFSEARHRLEELIRDLPDYPEGVTPLGKNCCSVPFSLIGQHNNNLSAGYWSMRASKRALLEMLNSSKSADSILKNIENLLTNGKLRRDQGFILPHPEFIEALRKVWYL